MNVNTEVTIKKHFLILGNKTPALIVVGVCAHALIQVQVVKSMTTLNIACLR